MSLTGSLNNALSGLQVNQALMRISSSNISNSNTEGYTRKIANLGSVSIEGQVGGVRIESVTRAVDNYLVKQINGQTSIVSAADGLTEFYTRLQDLFGTPNDNSSISGLLNSLRTSLENLATDPQQSVSQFTTVTAAQDVVNTLNDISETLQAFRQEVDKQVGDGIDIVNKRLTEIDSLNDQIVRLSVLGQPIGDLEDKRDAALQDIAKQMDIKWFTRPNGAVYVMTTNNETLLDNEPRFLDFSSPSGVSKATVYPGGFSPIAVTGSNPDITTEIASGRIKSMIDMRDTILPGLQDQLDQLASRLAEEMNRAHNSAMPIPALKTFTGTTTYTSADLLDPANPASIALTAYTNPTTSVTSYGTIEFAITDASGNAVGDALRVNLDEFKTEMETYVSTATGSPFTYQLTVGDIINMLNGAYAATPPGGTPVPAAPAGWPGAVPWPPSPALTMTSTGSDIAGLTNMSGAGVAGGYAGGTFARMNSGHLEISLPSTSSYGIAINDTLTTFADPNDTTRPSAFNYLLGLNDLFIISDTADSAARDISVRSDIVADPAKLGRAYLNSTLTDPSDPTTETWYLGRGDGAGATAMANIFDSQFLLGGMGSLPQSNQRLTEYAASIVQFNARGASNAADDVTFQTNLKTQLENRYGEISGVSVDEELSKLVTIQSSFAASARVVTTVNSMYDDLLNLVR